MELLTHRRISLSGRRAPTAVALLLGLLQISLPEPSRAASLAADENGLRSAFLLNFAKFVEWPQPSVAEYTFCIGVLGDDPLSEAAAASLAGKSLNGKPLEVKGFASLEDLEACPVVFVGSRDEDRSREALEALAGAPILTVGEGRDFLGQGGVIRLIRNGRRIQFEINVAASKRQGLRIGSQLLRLAQDVYGQN